MQQFFLSKFAHLQLVAEMEKVAWEQTGIRFSFSFELAIDGNTDLYKEKPVDFTREQVEKLVDVGWFDNSALDLFQDNVVFDPFWLDDHLGQSHMLFQFMLEKTFGEGSNVVGIEDTGEVIILTIATPA